MSKRIVILSSLLLLVGLASPTLAETVYVPLVADRTIDGARVDVQVRLTNSSPSEVRRARHLFLRSYQDGSEHTAKDGRVAAVDPNAAVMLRNVARQGQSGFLRVNSGPQIQVESRFVGTAANGARTIGELAPAIGEDDFFVPGAVALLEGWRRAPGEVRTDFHILNLAQRKATCTIDLVRGNGSPVIQGLRLDIPAYTHVPFADALAAAGIERAGNWASAVSCNRSFYPYLTRQNLIDGEVALIAPTLEPETPATPEPPPETPESPENPTAGAVVFERPGVFHTPTKSKEMHTIQLPLRKGARYSKVVVDMKFTHGGWHADSDANHGIFWLNRHPNWGDNVFGYLNAFGPGRNTIKLSSNVGARRGQMYKKSVGARLQPGQTYKAHFEYDTKKGIYWAEVKTLSGQRVGGRIQLAAQTHTIHVKDSGGFFIAFGHTRHAVGPEVPTYGWKYSDLKVQFIK